ncbi:MAG: hypothetical protein AMXMBFR61_19560 [Fimbriimonadales bacterium]
MATFVFVCLLTVALATVSFGAPQTPLRIIPSPQSVTLTEGSFALDRITSISVASGSEDDTFAASQLAEELRDAVGIHPTVSKGVSGSVVLVRASSADSEADSLLQRLPDADIDGSYALSVGPNRIVVASQNAAGIFYGVQTLKHLVRANRVGEAIPCCSILDWPALKVRGWQDDISRGPIPTLDYLKRQVRTMSEYKLNAFTLYTEHVFKLKKHPTIAPPDGITAEEVRELTRYAKRYHVEVIGNFQSFGHFANILRVPGYEHLGEAGWVISPAKEESYQFLADVYSEIAPAYESPLFNINCDETAGLGTGASKEMVEKEGIGAVYARHIVRIADLLRPYGKTALMWGDIALHHRDIIPRLPKDLVVLSWGYHAADNFDEAIQPFTELGFRFMVCPGVSCWSQVYPDLRNACINISNYIRDGARHGAMGVINTTWDDSGENLFNANWYPLIWGAECSWRPAVPEAGEDANTLREARLAQFDEAFGPLFHGTDGTVAAGLLHALSGLRQNPASGGMNDGAFWRRIDEVYRRNGSVSNGLALAREAGKIRDGLEDLLRAHPKNADALEVAVHAARRAAFGGLRVMVAHLLRADDATRMDKAADGIRQLVTEARALREEYRKLWLAENRRWWLDRNLAKWDSLIAELEALPKTPIILPGKWEFHGTQEVEMTTIEPGAIIRYTLDGSDPTEQSPAYDAKLRLDRTTVVRARAYYPDGTTGGIAEARYRTLALPATVETSLPTYETYAPTNAIDGDEESFFWCSRGPVEGDTFTIRLDQSMGVSRLKVLSGHREHSSDIVYAGVLEVSANGMDYEPVAEFSNGAAEVSFGPGTTRSLLAVRVRIVAPSPYWVTIREVVVE